MPFTIQTVWKSTTPAIEKELADFWVAEKALPDVAAAAGRAKQVVCITRTETGAIAALCSVQLKVVPRLKQRLYYYRTFVAAEHRGNKLIVPLMQAAKQALLQFTLAQAKPDGVGIIIEFENKALGQSYNVGVHPETGFVFIGYSQRGLRQAAWYFEGITFPPPIQMKKPSPIKTTN